MCDPFSWLVSKYFWHRPKNEKTNGSTCDDFDKKAVLTDSIMHHPRVLEMKKVHNGWTTHISLGYIMCLQYVEKIVFLRNAEGTATLADLEAQAERNLRQAFAVVGILEDVDTFYEMLTAHESST